MLAKSFRPTGLRLGGHGLTRLSFVTDDGIDLWTKVAGRSGVMWSAEATRVKRHAAPADDAQPPGDLLSLDSWFENVPPADVALPDFEPVMERADDPRRTTQSSLGSVVSKNRLGAIPLNQLTRDPSF